MGLLFLLEHSEQVVSHSFISRGNESQYHQTSMSGSKMYTCDSPPSVKPNLENSFLVVTGYKQNKTTPPKRQQGRPTSTGPAQITSHFSVTARAALSLLASSKIAASANAASCVNSSCAALSSPSTSFPRPNFSALTSSAISRPFS